MAIRQVISCPWQDEQGNVLALGKIVFEASGDALVSGAGELCSGIKGSLSLDSNGQVAASPAQYMWPTDQMVPSGITYTVWVYSANGQLAWGPNYNLTVPSGAGSFNLCTWVPNQTGGGSGASSGSLTLQTNGVNNGSQSLLNLVEGANITIIDDGSGDVTISSGGSNGPRTRGWRGWTTDGEAGVHPTQGFGCIPGVIIAGGGGYTAINPTATTPSMTGIGTGSSATSLSFIDWSAGNDYNSLTLGVLGLAETQIAVPNIANVRVWVGLSGNINNFLESDAPAEPTVAFRYSTHASDSTWKCVVTDGTTQVSVDSGVAVDTSVHKFALEFSAPNVLFFIDGVQVGSVAISTTTLTTASLFNGFTSVDNVGLANNKTFAIAYYYWDTNV